MSLEVQWPDIRYYGFKDWNEYEEWLEEEEDIEAGLLGRADTD